MILSSGQEGEWQAWFDWDGEWILWIEGIEMKPYRNERGQAIVLIALALVAVFGFAALAIDGGRVFSEKRRAQNAADSAAYAAASAAVDGGDWQQAGLDQASLNAYTDPDAGANPGQELDVMGYHPPQDGPYAGNNQYYQVKIRDRVEQVFSQIVYPHGLEISAEAVAYAKLAGPPSGDDAIVALTPDGCQGIKFHGTSTTRVRNGNINSKSNRNPANPHTPASCDSMSLEGGGGQDPNVLVEGGDVVAAGSINFPPGTLTITGGNQYPNTPTDPIPPISPPNCAGMAQYTGDSSITTGSHELYPGIYPNGIKISGEHTQVHFNRGMYCLYGDENDGLIVTGGIITSDFFPGGGENGVMFYVRDGSVSLTGSGDYTLVRPNAVQDADGREFGGMLFFMPYENTGEIHMSGGAGTFYAGTIYAPGPRSPATQYKCNIEGNTAVFSVNSSIICYSITIGGTVPVTIDYDQSQNFQESPVIELAQ
jgi:hypothetical protein